MGTWRVSADLLASSRFLISPLAETVAALTVLDHPTGPSEQAFSAANRRAFNEMLAAHPQRRTLVDRAWRPRRGSRPGWMADCLLVPPTRPDRNVEQELDDLAGLWDDAGVRAALLQVDPTPLPRRHAGGEGWTEALLGLLGWVWTATVAADWPRRERVLRADVVSRTSTLARAGWSGVIPTLGATREWQGDGRLRINRYDLPERDLSRAESLAFVPVHASGSWVCWTEPVHYAIVYPVTGIRAAAAGVRSGDGLARLVGVNRARVLVMLDDPVSTTGLSERLDLPLGAVGNHLRVLLDAGLVLRRRAGREVLYWRTATGNALVASSATP